MLTSRYRPVHKGRPGPGAALCARCSQLTEHHRLTMMVKAGNTKGVWWCDFCTEELEGANHGNDARRG